MAILARLQKQTVHLKATGSGWLDLRGLWTGQIPGWSIFATSANTAQGKWEMRIYAADPNAELRLVQRVGTEVRRTFNGTGHLGLVLDVPEPGWNFYIDNRSAATDVDVLIVPL